MKHKSLFLLVLILLSLNLNAQQKLTTFEEHPFYSFIKIGTTFTVAENDSIQVSYEIKDGSKLSYLQLSKNQILKVTQIYRGALQLESGGKKFYAQPSHVITRAFTDDAKSVYTVKKFLNAASNLFQSQFWYLFVPLLLLVGTYYLFQTKISRKIYEGAGKEYSAPRKDWFLLGSIAAGFIPGFFYMFSPDPVVLYYTVNFTLIPLGHGFDIAALSSILLFFILLLGGKAYYNFRKLGKEKFLILTGINWAGMIAAYFFAFQLSMLVVGVIVVGVVTYMMINAIASQDLKSQSDRGFKGTCTLCNGSNGLHNPGCPYFHNNQYRDDPQYNDNKKKKK